MWFYIIAGMLLGVLTGFAYISYRLRETTPIKKIARGKKKLGFLLGLGSMLIFFIILYLTMHIMNAMIVILHLIVIWVLGDLLYRLLFKKSKKKPAYDYVVCGVITVTLLYLSVGWYYAHHVYETTYQLTSDKVQSTLKVVQITDSHLGATFHWQDFEKHMQTIQATNPDVLVITGDYVDDESSYEDMVECCRILGEMKTTYGVYFVFGNHDKGYYGGQHRGYSAEELVHELEKNHITVLEDEVVMLTDEYCLIGRQDASVKNRASMEDLMQQIDSSVYSIVLDHQPNDYAAQEEARVDLVLSGHTHGGQLLPINYMGEWTGLNDQTYGLETRGKQQQQSHFIVSSGISNWAIWFKTGCIAEYVVITIGKTAGL